MGTVFSTYVEIIMVILALVVMGLIGVFFETYKDVIGTIVGAIVLFCVVVFIVETFFPSAVPVAVLVLLLLYGMMIMDWIKKAPERRKKKTKI